MKGIPFVGQGGGADGAQGTGDESGGRGGFGSLTVRVSRVVPGSLGIFSRSGSSRLRIESTMSEIVQWRSFSLHLVASLLLPHGLRNRLSTSTIHAMTSLSKVRMPLRGERRRAAPVHSKTKPLTAYA